MDPASIAIGAAAVLGVTILTSLRILLEYERGVVFRLGRLTRAKGPGLIFLVPWGIERMKKMDLRIVALDIAPQDTITKDNVSVRVNAVVYFRVADPTTAVIEIEDYYFATSQLAQTTLRSVIGQSELDELLAQRDRNKRERPSDNRPGHGPVGHRGHRRRSQGHRSTAGDEAGHGQAGRGRARAARKGDQRSG